MSDSKAPAIRARLRYANVAEFKAGYSKFVSTGGMFIPVPESKLKPVGTDIRFQFMLNNGETVLLGKGNVLQVRRPDPNTPNSPVGILVKFSKLSQDSKKIIDEIVAEKDTQKVPTQEVIVDEQEVEDAARGNYPTPAALDAISAIATKDDISDDQTVVGTLDDIFRSQSPSTSLDEKTPTPEQLENPEPVVEEPIAELALEEPLSEPDVKIEPDDLIFSAAPEPEQEPEEIPIEKPASNIRVLSYDDMSAVDTDKVDFGFSGEESEIDDMFDDLFGKSGDNSFFDDVLGGDSETANAVTPKATPVLETPIVAESNDLDDVFRTNPSAAEPFVPADTEPELPVFAAPDPAPPALEEPIFEEESEPEFLLEEPVHADADPAPFPNIASPDDSLSMDDAFESEPEDEISGASDSLLGGTASDPFERINEVYESEDENPFRSDPPSIEMDLDFDFSDADKALLVEEENDADIETEDATVALSADSFQAITANDSRPDNLPQMDAESSVVEFDLEPDASEVAFESFEEPEDEVELTDMPPAYEPDISRDSELDGLLGNLESDTPLDRSYDFSHDVEVEKPEEGMSEDSDSLEALLALANKDIESKKEEEQEEVDILDQLLGDEDLPPLPDIDNSFTMPTPESSGKKKGLFSKFFGKD